MDELLKDIAKKPQAGEKGEKDKDKGEKQQENNDPVLPMASGTKLFVAAGRAMQLMSFITFYLQDRERFCVPEKYPSRRKTTGAVL